MSHQDFLAALANDATRVVLAPNGAAFRIRRVRSADIAKTGHAELLGVSRAKMAMQEVQEEFKAEAEARRREMKLEHIEDPTEREKAQANFEAWAKTAIASKMEQVQRQLEARPKVVHSMLNLADLMCCAGIVEGGRYIGPELEANHNDWPTYIGEVSADDCEMGPVKFVEKEEHQNPERGILCVSVLDENTRQWLSGQIDALSNGGGASLLKTFREASRPAGPAVQAGEGVRDRPVDDPALG